MKIIPPVNSPFDRPSRPLPRHEMLAIKAGLVMFAILAAPILIVLAVVLRIGDARQRQVDRRGRG